MPTQNTPRTLTLVTLHHDKAGDTSNVRGVALAAEALLERTAPGTEVRRVEVDAQTVRNDSIGWLRHSDIPQGSDVVVIGAGTEDIEPLGSLKLVAPTVGYNVRTVWSGVPGTDPEAAVDLAYAVYSGGIDTLIYPHTPMGEAGFSNVLKSSIAGRAQQGNPVTCIAVPGVPHDVTRESVQAAAVEWRNAANASANQYADSPAMAWQRICSDSRPVIAVALGGTVDGVQMDREGITKLAFKLADEARERGARLVVTDSPRTPPQVNAAFRKAIDAYNGAVEKVDGPSTQPVQCDFFPHTQRYPGQAEQVGGTDYSVFQPMIALVQRNPKSVVVTTDDSVSMPAQLTAHLGPKQVWVAETNVGKVGDGNFTPAYCVEGMHALGLLGRLREDEHSVGYQLHEAPPRTLGWGARFRETLGEIVQGFHPQKTQELRAELTAEAEARLREQIGAAVLGDQSVGGPR